jgi:DNA-binding MarR family transcriptional regulator
LLHRLLERVKSAQPAEGTGNASRCDDSYLKVARDTLEYRRRRYRYFPRGMLGEPAFDIMLSLYVAESEQRHVTHTMIAEMAEVPSSSAHRWIDFLAGKRFLDRAKHPFDSRATVLMLTPEGRKSLQSLFDDIVQVGREASGEWGVRRGGE